MKLNSPLLVHSSNSVIPKEPSPLPEKAVLEVNGKTYELPVLKGTLGDELVDIRNLMNQTGLTTYDPGYTCTASCMSAITYINGDEGELMYRGYKI
jgi:citrate synthase